MMRPSRLFLLPLISLALSIAFSLTACRVGAGTPLQPVAELAKVKSAALANTWQAGGASLPPVGPDGALSSTITSDRWGDLWLLEKNAFAPTVRVLDLE